LNKVARFQKKAAEARGNEEQARQQAQLALHDRNVLVCALLSQHQGAIVIPQSALDAAAQQTGLLRYDRGTAVLGREVKPGFFARLLAAFRPGAVPAELLPAFGGGGVAVPVLTLRGATQEEQAAAKEAAEKAAHKATADAAAAETDRVRTEGARIPDTTQ
jgi:hypothetical protein